MARGENKDSHLGQVGRSQGTAVTGINPRWRVVHQLRVEMQGDSPLLRDEVAGLVIRQLRYDIGIASIFSIQMECHGLSSYVMHKVVSIKQLINEVLCIPNKTCPTIRVQ